MNANPQTVRDFRRNQIIAAARSIVASEGLSALTFGSLERALPFTRGVITHHFKSKDDVVAAVLDSAVREIDTASIDAVDMHSDPVDRVRAAISGVTQAFLARPEATRVVVAYWSVIPGNKDAALVNAELFARWQRRCAGLVTDGQKAGAFRCDIEASTVGELMVGHVMGIVAQQAFGVLSDEVQAVGLASRAVVALLTSEPVPRRSG